MTGVPSIILGDLVAGCDALEQALAHYHRQSPAALGTGEQVHILAWLSYVLWVLGYPDQALARSQESVALARSQESVALAQALAHPPTLALALTIAGAACHAFRREAASVAEYTEWLQRLVAEKHLVAYRPWVSSYHGWLLVHGEQDQADEGVARMRASIDALQAFRPYRLTLLAEAYLLAGQGAAGLQMVDEALALVEETGARLNTRRRCTGCGGSCCPGRERHAERKPRSASGKPSTRHGGKRPNRGSCERRRAWPDCGRRRVGQRMRGLCWTASMTGSARGSTRRTWSRRGRCWQSWREKRRILMVLYSRERPKSSSVVPAISKT